MTVTQNHNQTGNKTITLGVMDKVVAVGIAIGTIVFSVGGNYVLTSYRLNEHDKAIEKQDSRITQMENFGHPDHERRITKLESKQDIDEIAIGTVNTTLATLSAKIDTVLTIVRRNDRDSQTQDASR